MRQIAKMIKNVISMVSVRAALLSALSLALPIGGQAQQFSVQQGQASQLNLLDEARNVSMRNMYNRALYLYVRSNPGLLDDQQFYVNFLIFLMSQSSDFDCDRAFSNEFERRDFFTNSFAMKDQLRQIVNSVWIPERFDIAFTIDTGRYDFSSTNLPFSEITAVGLRETLSNSIDLYRGRSCASDILRGTSVDSDKFAWTFAVVDEIAERKSPRFPFGSSMQLSTNDARVLFDRFGRRLYAVVSYQFKAANNGEQLIQIIPTDAQLFGLSSDAVVRVQSYTHPTLSQASYLDITNPLKLDLHELGMVIDVNFDQEGFRAVATGTRTDSGTDITTGGVSTISGSAAVGNSVFIMRFATPKEFKAGRKLVGTAGNNAFMTLFGSVDFEKISNTRAPVSGLLQILEQSSGQQYLKEVENYRFRGAFRPAGSEVEEPQSTTQEESQLD